VFECTIDGWHQKSTKRKFPKIIKNRLKASKTFHLLSITIPPITIKSTLKARRETAANVITSDNHKNRSLSI
jgi:hypothetical protein